MPTTKTLTLTPVYYRIRYENFARQISALSLPRLATNIFLYYEAPTGGTITKLSYSVELRAEGNRSPQFQTNSKIKLLSCPSNTDNGTAVYSDQDTRSVSYPSSDYTVPIEHDNQQYQEGNAYIGLTVESLSDQTTALYLTSLPALNLTVSIPDLTIDVDPGTVTLSSSTSTTLFFSDANGRTVNYTVTANGKTVASGNNLQDGLPRTSVVLYPQYKWFTDANYSGDTLHCQISASDDLGRKTASPVSLDVNVPALTMSMDAPATSGSNIVLGFTNRLHTLDLTVTGPNNIALFPPSGAAAVSGDSYTISAEDDWFQKANGNSMQVTVSVKDREWPFISCRNASASFKLEASDNCKPTITAFQLSNISDSRIPTEYGYVRGYSKVGFWASVDWSAYAAGSTVSVQYGGKSVTLKKESGHYTGQTDEAITGGQQYKVIATDERLRTAEATRTINANDVNTLAALSLELSSRTLIAGNTVTVTPKNAITPYSYSFTCNSHELAGETNLQASSFQVTTDVDWFTQAGVDSPQMQVAVSIKDALGREYNTTISVNLPNFSISIPNDQSTRQIGEYVQININGNSGRRVDFVFTTTINGNVLQLHTNTTTSTRLNVRCEREWFTSNPLLDNENQITVQVVASIGNSTSTQSFTLKYPQLTFAITGLTENAVTAGDTINFDIGGAEDETITVALTKGSTELDSTTGTSITTNKNYFDKAKDKTNQLMQITATASDKRKRTKSLNFYLKASNNMKPGVLSIQHSIVQPSPASTDYPSTYIANVSRVTVSSNFNFPTMAKMKAAYLKYGDKSLRMTLVQGTQRYQATTTEPIEGNTTFTIEVEDERGLKNSNGHTVSGVYAYAPPTVTIDDYYRCNAQGVEDAYGEKVKIIASYVVSPIDGSNKKTASVVSTSGHHSQSDTLSSYTQTITYVFGDAQYPVDIEHSYSFTIAIADSVTSTSQTIRLSTAAAIMDFISGGDGIGLGKIAEEHKTVEVNPEWYLKSAKIKVKVGNDYVDLSTLLSQIKAALGMN